MVSHFGGDRELRTEDNEQNKFPNRISLILIFRNCSGAMKCFTAAITLWLAAVVSQIYAEVSATPPHTNFAD
jgi:hypothetical protein